MDSGFQEDDFILSISTQGGIPINYCEPALVPQVQEPFEPFDFDSQVFKPFLRDFADETQNTEQFQQLNETEEDLQYDSPFLNAIIEKECILDDLRVIPIAEKLYKEL